MLKTILITLAVLGIIVAAGIAWAKQSGFCSPESRIQKITERVGRKLDLNDDQQGRLETFAEALRGLRSDRQAHRVAAKEAIAELLAASSLDRDRAIDLIDERFRGMNDSKRALVDAFADFSDSMAPEQRSRLTVLIGDRLMGRWGHPRGAH
jgi:Spy/CpxP family protein refolding chaperone